MNDAIEQGDVAAGIAHIAGESGVEMGGSVDVLGVDVDGDESTRGEGERGESVVAGIVGLEIVAGEVCGGQTVIVEFDDLVAGVSSIGIVENLVD